MELRHLRYFVTVAHLGHYRRAAEQLHITQPALSRQIQVLESDLGFKLFERSRRGAKLSIAGQCFLEDAKRILHEVDRARERGNRVARGQLGTLRVGFTELGSGEAAVLEAIRRFRAAEPDVELVLSPMNSTYQLDALKNGQIDVGFLFRMGEPDYELDQYAMNTENIVLALLAGHRLATRRSVSLADLKQEPLICIARTVNAVFFDSLMASFRAGGLTPTVVQQASSGSLVLSLVSVGMGVGIVSSAMRKRQPDGIVLKRVRDLSVPYRFELVWRKDNKSPALARFIGHVVSQARKRRAG